MEQVYWLSPAVAGGAADERVLLYRYGAFVYTGPVITEPVRGLEYLPGVLAGIQAVQGQVPYLCEVKDLPTDSSCTTSLLALQRALDVIHGELERHTARLADLAQADGGAWLDEDDAALYFEFQAPAGYTCNGSEVIFAKSFRGEVMLSAIWYAPTGCFYVTLTPSSGEEQALVDTLFPQIYGKRRGMTLHEYVSSPPFYDSSLDALYAHLAEGRVGTRPPAVLAAAAGSASEGKEGEGAGDVADAASTRVGMLCDASRLIVRVSVWEASDAVPDPEAMRLRDEAESKAMEGKEGEEGEGGPTVDVSGGEGYTQVYLVMSPSTDAARTAVVVPPEGDASAASADDASTVTLVPREVLFRFGNWVYGGAVEFPVETLRLGDVPFVLPALQKQQGRLEYLGDAGAFPAEHPLAGVMTQFTAAVALLKHEMEDAQGEVAALSEQSVNAWIDVEWAASFFELAFAPGSIAGNPASPGVPAAGLTGAEVIASKLYLFSGTGVVLHVVWFRGSLYCVLADNVDDLPLLDVAFPDVTARNRVVQVRDYAERTGRKLADAFPGSPLPKSLRVWEGRRKGIAGVGTGAAGALATAGGASTSADALKAKAKEKGEKTAAAAAAAAASSNTISTDAVAASAAAAPVATDVPVPAAPVAPKPRSSADDDALFSLPATSSAPHAAAAPPSAHASSPHHSHAAGTTPISSGTAIVPRGGIVGASSFTPVTSAPGGGLLSAMPSQLYHSVARAPHHVAPISSLTRGGGAGTTRAAEAGGNRLIVVGGASDTAAEGKGDDDAPWDAQGRPRKRL